VLLRSDNDTFEVINNIIAQKYNYVFVVIIELKGAGYEVEEGRR